VGARLRELLGYREILLNLVRKELKVKYTASVLGAVWSLLNPIVYLAVFTFVVTVLGNRVTDFQVFLLSGLLAWNLFAGALSQGSRSVIDNANLVKKVAFPREILPLSAVGVALFDFALQSVVLFAYLLVSGHGLHLSALALYPVSFVTLLVFTSAATLWVSAMNVRYRDVQHLLTIALLVWFWMTPIVYQGWLVQRRLAGHTVAGVSVWGAYLVNPLASITFGFQRALYGDVWPAGSPERVLPDVTVGWLLGVLALVLLASLVLLYVTWRLFFRLSGDFAEDL
jgi:ABC-2 type transport system permease protein